MKTKMYNTKSSFNLESIRRLTRTIFRMSMMVFVLFFISSDIEDGMDGIDGIAGIARTDGIDGEQGSAGTILAMRMSERLLSIPHQRLGLTLLYLLLS